MPLRPVGLVRAPGARCCHGGAAISRRPLGCCGCGGLAAFCCFPPRCVVRSCPTCERCSDLMLAFGTSRAGHGGSSRHARIEPASAGTCCVGIRVGPHSTASGHDWLKGGGDVMASSRARSIAPIGVICPRFLRVASGQRSSGSSETCSMSIRVRAIPGSNMSRQICAEEAFYRGRCEN